LDRRQVRELTGILEKVVEGYEGVGFSTTIRERERTYGLRSFSAQPLGYVAGEIPHAAGGKRQLEELGRVFVDRTIPVLSNHVVETGGEGLHAELSALHVFADLNDFVPRGPRSRHKRYVSISSDKESRPAGSAEELRFPSLTGLAGAAVQVIRDAFQNASLVSFAKFDQGL
jgi:hypothetical protein